MQNIQSKKWKVLQVYKVCVKTLKSNTSHVCKLKSTTREIKIAEILNIAVLNVSNDKSETSRLENAE